MKLSKRDDGARKWRSFKRHTMLLCQLFLSALLAVLAWYQLAKAEIHFPKADEGVLTTAVVATLAITFSIIAALVLNSIWEKYQKVVIAVLEQDEHTFLLYRDERIPIVLHLLLASLSVPIIGMVMMFEYKGFWSGAASTFCITFAISIYWLVVVQLESPTKSPWFAERIPSEWLTADIDTHFKLERAHQKKR